MSGGCRVHAGTPWQWLFKEGVSCSPASPCGTGFFPLCLERTTWSCRGAMTGFSTFSLVSSISQLFIFVGGINDGPWGCSTFRVSKGFCFCGFEQSGGEMDGSLPTEEAPKPICGSFCFASWKSLPALIPALDGDFYVSAIEICRFSDTS